MATRESNLEAQFAYLLRTIGDDLPCPVREYVFASPRKWRFDYAFPEDHVAVELEGGTFANGRHTRPIGFENDCAKYNEAACLGWRVLRFTSRMLREQPDACIDTLRRLVGLPFVDEDDEPELEPEPVRIQYVKTREYGVIHG